jgi:hypothetical protein
VIISLSKITFESATADHISKTIHTFSKTTRMLLCTLHLAGSVDFLAVYFAF